ncbi:219_t:CDS:1, partial [Racocetra fulgida]
DEYGALFMISFERFLKPNASGTIWFRKSTLDYDSSMSERS